MLDTSVADPNGFFICMLMSVGIAMNLIFSIIPFINVLLNGGDTAID